MVDLLENLAEKAAHFTFKTTGPAGQFCQIESALFIEEVANSDFLKERMHPLFSSLKVYKWRL